MLAAWAFKQRAREQSSKVEIRVLEPDELGGEFLRGGLKYLRHSPAVESLLGLLGLEYEVRDVRGGILLDPVVYSFPEHLSTLKLEDAVRIQGDHFRKTRGVDLLGKHTSMNDPFAKEKERKVVCDVHKFCYKLLDTVAADPAVFNVIPRPLYSVAVNNVAVAGAQALYYDYMVLTLPLWATRGKVPWDVPKCHNRPLNAALIKTTSNLYKMWDYVYTPYTPFDFVHRMSPAGEDKFWLEANGLCDNDKFEGEARYLFHDKYEVERVVSGLKGHLLPLEGEQPVYPENVAPLGRFAEWYPRATVDYVLERAQELARRWLR